MGSGLPYARIGSSPRQTWLGGILESLICHSGHPGPSLIRKLNLLQETQASRTCVTVSEGSIFERKINLLNGEYVPVILQPTGNLKQSTLTQLLRMKSEESHMQSFIINDDEPYSAEESNLS